MSSNVNDKNVNALKLHLILSNVMTKILHIKLEEEIQSRNPGNPRPVQYFLRTNYHDYDRFERRN